MDASLVSFDALRAAEVVCGRYAGLRLIRADQSLSQGGLCPEVLAHEN